MIGHSTTTVDRRSRFAGDAVALHPDDFFEDRLPAMFDARSAEAGRAAARAGLPSLTFLVEEAEFTFDVADELLVLRRGPVDDSLTVELDRAAFSDLMQDVASTFGIRMADRVDLRRGALDDFVAWEPVLRCLLDARPVYEPGSITLQDRAGGSLDLHRSFTLDDAPEEIGHFLAEAGYLHIEGMFSEEEMRAVSAELDDAIAAAERDDGASWWARTTQGEWYPSRILGFNQKSPTLRDLLHSERFASLAAFTDDTFIQRDPDLGDSAEGLYKKVGVVEGISDVSWHKDCSLGDHSRRCCGLTVGISVTGATRDSGELGAVAGSHRANVPHLGIERIDMPRVPLPTRSGDVTVHCSCTLHMSRPPVSAERRVVYTGFDLAPRPSDRAPELDDAEIRRRRAALNDATRDAQRRLDLTERSVGFDL